MTVQGPGLVTLALKMRDLEQNTWNACRSWKQEAKETDIPTPEVYPQSSAYLF